MRWRSLVPFSALALLPAAAQSAYTLEQVYAGDTFYDGWEFWGNRDNLTNGAPRRSLPPCEREHADPLERTSLAGATYYVTKGESAGVAYTNEAGNAIIRVDNRSELAPNGLRNSVRMTTARTFDLGRLIVMDALHLPYGVRPSSLAGSLLVPTAGADPGSPVLPSAVCDLACLLGSRRQLA